MAETPAAAPAPTAAPANTKDTLLQSIKALIQRGLRDILKIVKSVDHQSNAGSYLLRCNSSVAGARNSDSRCSFKIPLC